MSKRCQIVSRPPASPEERYGSLVDELLSSTDATLSDKKGFGSSGLWVGGRLFAMLVEDRLVVKLPRQRVEALIAAGEGERFDPGHGRLMKEWLTVAPTSEERWLPLASEALEFVASKR
jgi:TfoX/Sxy family transcriptional regulator of competence genes